MATTDKGSNAGTAGSNSANAEANADASQQQPGGTKPATDATKPADPDAGKSVGGDNPNQQTAASNTGQSTGTDQQGAATREAQTAQEQGQPAATATVGQTVSPVSMVKHPSEGVGYTPAPAPNTGDADSDSVSLTQAAQRLVHPDDAHPVPNALGIVTNIPPGSRPMMIDPNTGLGVQPPQQEGAEPQPD